jgi:hypothetical protein
MFDVLVRKTKTPVKMDKTGPFCQKPPDRLTKPKLHLAAVVAGR